MRFSFFLLAALACVAAVSAGFPSPTCDAGCPQNTTACSGATSGSWSLSLNRPAPKQNQLNVVTNLQCASDKTINCACYTYTVSNSQGTAASPLTQVEIGAPSCSPYILDVDNTGCGAVPVSRQTGNTPGCTTVAPGGCGYIFTPTTPSTATQQFTLCFQTSISSTCGGGYTVTDSSSFHVNTINFVVPCCTDPPTVACQNPVGTYDLVNPWSLTKTVNTPVINLPAGQSQQVTWSLTATENPAATQTDFVVSTQYQLINGDPRDYVFNFDDFVYTYNYTDSHGAPINILVTGGKCFVNNVQVPNANCPFSIGDCFIRGSGALVTNTLPGAPDPSSSPTIADCSWTATPQNANTASWSLFVPITGFGPTINSVGCNFKGITFTNSGNENDALLGDNSTDFTAPQFPFGSTTVTQYNSTFSCPAESDTSFWGNNLEVSYNYDNEGTLTETLTNDVHTADASVTVNCYRPDYKVTTKGYASADHLGTWSISKSVNPTSAILFDGQSTTPQYTVSVTKVTTLIDQQAYETFTITNNNNLFPFTVDSISATYTRNSDHTVENANAADITNCLNSINPIPAGGSASCTVHFDVSTDDVFAGSMSVTVNVGSQSHTANDNNVVVSPGNGDQDNSATVTDTNSAGPQTDVSASTTFPNYGVQYDCPSASSGKYDSNGYYTKTFPNTATVTPDGPPGQPQQATADFTLTCYLPSITLTGSATYDTTHKYTLSKTVDVPSWSGTAGDSETVNWIITTTDTATDSNFAESYTVTLTNPNTQTDAAVSSLSLTTPTGHTFQASDLASAGCQIPVPHGQQTSCTVTWDPATRQNGQATLTVNFAAGSYSPQQQVLIQYTQVHDVDASASLTDSAVDGSNNAVDSGVPSPQVVDTNSAGTNQYPFYFQCSVNSGDYNSQGTYSYTVTNTAVLTPIDTKVPQSSSAATTFNCVLPQLYGHGAVVHELSYTWTLDKEVTTIPAQIPGPTGPVQIDAEQTLPANYQIFITRTPNAPYNYRVYGHVCVKNTGNDVLTFSTPTVTISTSTAPVSVTCASNSVGPLTFKCCKFTGPLSGYTSTAALAVTVTNNGQNIPLTATGGLWNDPTADPVVNASATLSDSQPSVTLSQTSFTGDGPWEVDYTINYACNFADLQGTNKPFPYDWPNTATLTTSDNTVLTSSADVQYECFPPPAPGCVDDLANSNPPCFGPIPDRFAQKLTCDVRVAQVSNPDGNCATLVISDHCVPSFP